MVKINTKCIYQFYKDQLTAYYYDYNKSIINLLKKIWNQLIIKPNPTGGGGESKFALQ